MRLGRAAGTSARAATASIRWKTRRPEMDGKLAKITRQVRRRGSHWESRLARRGRRKTLHDSQRRSGRTSRSTLKSSSDLEGFPTLMASRSTGSTCRSATP